MTRGEIWTVSGRGDFLGKPRLAVILQDDSFSGSESVTLCPLTTDTADHRGIRVLVPPSPSSGLSQPSSIMVDKITRVRRSKFGNQIGSLNESELTSLNEAVRVFLGLMPT